MLTMTEAAKKAAAQGGRLAGSGTNTWGSGGAESGTQSVPALGLGFAGTTSAPT
jgi:hypothetical protein